MQQSTDMRGKNASSCHFADIRKFAPYSLILGRLRSHLGLKEIEES